MVGSLRLSVLPFRCSLMAPISPVARLSPVRECSPAWNVPIPWLSSNRKPLTGNLYALAFDAKVNASRKEVLCL
jgi:hypothetical protein